MYRDMSLTVGQSIAGPRWRRTDTWLIGAAPDARDSSRESKGGRFSLTYSSDAKRTLRLELSENLLLAEGTHARQGCQQEY